MNALAIRGPRWSPSLRAFSQLPSPASSSPSPSSSSSSSSAHRLLQFRTQPLLHRRNAATSRRTTKALRMKPAPSAAAAALAARRMAPNQNSIVFNPPPTAPSPYQTPPLFLPASDPRRTLLAPVHAHHNPYRRPTPAGAGGAAEGAQGEAVAAEDGDAADLPPAVRPATEKTYHLDAAQIEEIRSKRTSNPWVWTRKRLAAEYGCSEYFISLCAQAIPERRKWHEKNLDAVKARWGPKRTKPARSV